MAPLRALGRHFGYRALQRRKDAHLPPRAMRPFALVESIGMIVPSHEEATFAQLMDYAFGLRQQQGKRVFVCTCSLRKPLPPYLAERQDVTLIGPKDLNWLQRPVAPAAQAFHNEPFDYLIDFTRQSVLPLEWILRLSHASLRVGFRSVASVDIHFPLPPGAGTQTQVEILERYLNSQR